MTTYRVLSDRAVLKRAEDCQTDELEIDEDILLSRAEDGSGTWVRAWLWIENPEIVAPHRVTAPERCNRPAWRYYPNGYRVCRDHAAMNDPDQTLAENEVGPCDYPLDGLGDAAYRTEATL